jgi:hypothetical protein
MATWPSGKARVCKTLITGSNPVVASAKTLPQLRLECFYIPELVQLFLILTKIILIAKIKKR